MTDQPTNPTPAHAEAPGNAKYEKTAHDLKKRRPASFRFPSAWRRFTTDRSTCCWT